MTKKPGSEINATTKQAVILHVEDDANDIELLKAAARRADVPIVLENAPDGEKAIQYLTAMGSQEGPSSVLPSLILVDLKLPRANGFEILEWVRSNPRTRHIPVVVLSGSELHSDIQRAYEAGANSYIVKPLGFEPLVSLVSEISEVWCQTSI